MNTQTIICTKCKSGDHLRIGHLEHKVDVFSENTNKSYTHIIHKYYIFCDACNSHIEVSHLDEQTDYECEVNL